jgi:hypothetical protein
MTNMKKLSVAVTLALSMGVASQAAHSEILFKPNGKGDALLFPVYNAFAENYFTISNNSDKWIQGHLRFRGAAWSSELLDMDIILTHGDVFVFRVADVDGDGDWELDQSLDANNFKYTAYNTNCKSSIDGTEVKDCMDFKKDLVPSPTGPLTKEVIDHHLKVGYIEFTGEAVLENMDHTKMNSLLSGKPSADLAPYVTKQGKGSGVTAWSWSDAANQFVNGNPLSDVPNALSGTAFITLPMSSHGLAYNAEAFVNFRTANVEVPAYYTPDLSRPDQRVYLKAHRIDNYRMKHDPKAMTYVSLDAGDEEIVKANRAVIVHDEDVSGVGTATPYLPYGDYVARFQPLAALGTQEDRADEAAMFFQNTWGPTLADGDDYELMGVRPTYGNIDPQQDDFDAPWELNVYNGWGMTNSIAEVEEAIRKDGQIYTSYYFDRSALPVTANDTAISSQFFAFFPTKVFWAPVYYYYDPKNAIADFNTYLVRVASTLVSTAKPYCLELWDITEREACRAKEPDKAFGSPFVPGSGGAGGGGSGTALKCKNTPACYTTLGLELNFFNINSIKGRFPTVEQSGVDLENDFLTGRVVFDPPEDANDPFLNHLRQSFPALMYTFELGENTDWSLSHWRPMQR